LHDDGAAGVAIPPFRFPIPVRAAHGNLVFLLFYRLLSILALAAYAPYALLQSLTGRRKIGSLRGRMGLLPYPDLSGGIWVHAVSVGEVGVARTLLSELARKAPGRPLGLSVSTAAGIELMRRRPAAGAASFAFPLDLAGPVDRALSRVDPGLVLLTETEIWPLFLERASARGIPVALVNGRLSERSFARYRLAGGWFARVLGRVSLYAMQTEEDAARIRRLGAREDRVFVTGNVKYDLPAPPPFSDAARLAAAAAGRPVLVAASTGEGEEDLVVSAWESVPDEIRPFLAVAPRRPERFDAVAALLRGRGFSVIRRSDPAPGPPPITRFPIYLLDSIGELAALYRGAKLAFVGGSLIPVGGHNPIEAWAAGVPVLVGPHTDNFREIVAAGERLGILRKVRGAESIAAALQAALADPRALAALGERARAAVAESRGAAARTADLVLPLLRPARRQTAAR
jgi:3-deoxy-D-manno-octulosonic-acid transferase